MRRQFIVLRPHSFHMSLLTNFFDTVYQATLRDEFGTEIHMNRYVL